MEKGNLFTPVNHKGSEIIEVLKDSNSRVERIISKGDVSPAGFWYDQNDWEFVAVIQGNAELETETERIKLNAGDWLIIEPHEKHRVSYTSSEPPCVWLAFFGQD